ncbi:helix-turn-helix domain-containing protein [Nocardioides sp.]|uniref:helix-turn-helix domain-containing protein n=1 Tax=Nocardioides sp. TaxID=35761 RepID=UPI00356818BD
MANRPADPLPLREGDRDHLLTMTRSSTLRAGLAQRARIVLLASQGLTNTAIADKVGVSRPTVIAWRDRYAESGLDGLDDRAREGRPRSLPASAIMRATWRRPPRRLGVPQWSSRLLGQELGIGHAAVTRAWQEYGVRPWSGDAYRFATRPELVAAVTDVIALCVAPPHNALVLTAREAAGDHRGSHSHPMAASTHLGPGSLHVALQVAGAAGAARPRRREATVLSMLQRLDARHLEAPTDSTVHLVVSDPDTLTAPGLSDWLTRHPWLQVHCTDGPEAWLHLVEAWLHLAEPPSRQRAARGPAAESTARVRETVLGWGPRSRPFAWTHGGAAAPRH